MRNSRNSNIVIVFALVIAGFATASAQQSQSMPTATIPQGFVKVGTGVPFVRCQGCPGYQDLDMNGTNRTGWDHPVYASTSGGYAVDETHLWMIPGVHTENQTKERGTEISIAPAGKRIFVPAMSGHDLVTTLYRLGIAPSASMGQITIWMHEAGSGRLKMGRLVPMLTQDGKVFWSWLEANSTWTSAYRFSVGYVRNETDNDNVEVFHTQRLWAEYDAKTGFWFIPKAWLTSLGKQAGWNVTGFEFEFSSATSARTFIFTGGVTEDNAVYAEATRHQGSNAKVPQQ